MSSTGMNLLGSGTARLRSALCPALDGMCLALCLTDGTPEALLILVWKRSRTFPNAAGISLVRLGKPCRMKEEMTNALAPKRSCRGMTAPQCLRLVAVRLEAGMRETPYRFYSVALHVARLDLPTKRRFLAFLAAEVHREAMSSNTSAPAVLDLLARAREVLSDSDSHASAGEQWQALAGDILAAETPRCRRRHIHCHGEVTSDRCLLFLRSLIPKDEADAFKGFKLQLTIAYAMADYEYDHFVLKGSHIAARVRALVHWVEYEMAQT